MNPTEQNYHCLTVRLPHPYLIFVEPENSLTPKRIETRPWTPGDLGLEPPFKMVIQAGKAIDTVALEFFRNQGLIFPFDPGDAGLVFGMVTVSKVEKYTRENWEEWKKWSYEWGEFPKGKNYFALFLEEPKRLDQRIKISGQPAVFPLPKALFRGMTSHPTK